MSSSINSLTTELHNGITIPVFGYRADKDHGNRNYENILTAIQAGFRNFDIACDIACFAIKTTSFVFSFAKTGIFKLLPTTCNCLIAAGL